MNNKIYQTNPYVSPRVEVYVVEVEQGIAVSEESVGGSNPDMGWDD